ncbi:MAG: GspH/FimT family pseudopilin [Pseudomonadota bacterium]
MKSATPQKGFSLLELLVTITIAGILLGIAVPALGNFLRGSRLSGGAREFIVDFALARNEAVLRAATVTVCTSSDMAACTNSPWTEGRIIFVDGGAIGTVDGGDVIIGSSRALNSALTVTSSGVATANVISFSPMGRITGVGQITVCAADQMQRDINIRASGSASLDKTTTAC